MLPKGFLTSRFAAWLAAAMIGAAVSTGLAPAPPMMFGEEIEWISPDGNEDAALPFGLSFDPADTSDADSDVHDALATSKRGGGGLIRSHVSRLLEGLRYRH